MIVNHAECGELPDTENSLFTLLRGGQVMAAMAGGEDGMNAVTVALAFLTHIREAAEVGDRQGMLAARNLAWDLGGDRQRVCDGLMLIAGVTADRIAGWNLAVAMGRSDDRYVYESQLLGEIQPPLRLIDGFGLFVMRARNGDDGFIVVLRVDRPGHPYPLTINLNSRHLPAPWLLDALGITSSRTNIGAITPAIAECLAKIRRTPRCLKPAAVRRAMDRAETEADRVAVQEMALSLGMMLCR